MKTLIYNEQRKEKNATKDEDWSIGVVECWKKRIYRRVS